MKTLKVFIIIIVSITLFIHESDAQDLQDSTNYSIVTNDGNEYIGRIVGRDEEKITLLTDKLGEIKIYTKDITSIKEISEESIKEGSYWFENPQAARYFWAPNGYGLKKGEAYYQNVWILFNQVSVGITDNFSVGTGIVPLFLIAGAPTPVWITPKFSIPVVKDQFNVGLGVLAGTVIGVSNSSFGILYGSATFGSKDKNLSVGLGYGYAGGELASSPVINVSGMFRTSPRGYLITENYYIGFGDQKLALLSFGWRVIIKKISLDFGGIIPLGQGGFIAIPWLGITIPMGKKTQL